MFHFLGTSEQCLFGVHLGSVDTDVEQTAKGNADAFSRKTDVGKLFSADLQHTDFIGLLRTGDSFDRPYQSVGIFG